MGTTAHRLKRPHLCGRDCDGPRAAGSATITSAAAAGAQNEENTTTLPPSPTEFIGCVAHSDHYDCSGPASTAATATPAAVVAAEEGDEHDHDGGETFSFPPPTESVGCKAHGDHYDCSGPAALAQATTPPTASGAVAGTNGTSVVSAVSATTPAPTPSARVAGTNGTSVLPFEGTASSSRVVSFAAMMGYIGAVGLMLLF
ncbi:MAG: hypothetical protein Q9207_005173 [Kuettlingeria erythrocarpa]